MTNQNNVGIKHEILEAVSVFVIREWSAAGQIKLVT